MKETGKLGSKLAKSPIDPNQKFGKIGEEALVDKGKYQRLVERLIYLFHITPDIAFVVSVGSQYMHSPYEEYL